MNDSYHIECLKQEIQTRHSFNSSYNYSAFARDIKISRGALSEILSGHRNLSYKNCQKIVAKFKWAPLKQKEFIYSAAKSLIKTGVRRIHPDFRRVLADKDHVLFDPHKIKQEKFSLIHQWYYIAILEITYTEKYSKNDFLQIGARLGISSHTAQKAIKTLLKFGYLEEQKGRLCKSHKKLTLSDPEKTTSYLIKHQEQIISLAKKKLRKIPIESRCNSSIAMAIDPKQLPLARKEIRLFLYRMSEILERGDQKKVYQLNVNLFPLEDENE